MKKVEQYIQEYTRNCSNEIGYCHKTHNHNHVFYSWLTPTHAECVAKIAREETIEEVCEWLRKEQEGCILTDMDIENLKKHFLDEHI